MPGPDSLTAGWHLDGPADNDSSGFGCDTIVFQALGEYTVAWDSVPGWITPTDSTHSLFDNDTAVLTGLYLPIETDDLGIVVDIDNNEYPTVVIGGQTWMAANLKVTHFRNGDPIPKLASHSEWTSSTGPGYCNYNASNAEWDEYGVLYNSRAVSDARGLAPEGWHVPTDDEWKQLEMYLGMTRAEADGYGLEGHR